MVDVKEKRSIYFSKKEVKEDLVKSGEPVISFKIVKPTADLFKAVICESDNELCICLILLQ